MSQVTVISSAERGYPLFGGFDPSELPRYTVMAASRHLKIPASTVRWWLSGRDYRNAPVVSSGSADHLSFNDLLELYVIRTLRGGSHRVTLKTIRKAVRYAEQKGIERVLLSPALSTCDGQILLEGLNEATAISMGGQNALAQLIKGLTMRIDRQELGAPFLHPDFAGESKVDGRYPVSLSPVVAFGKPTLSGYGIRTATISARVDSGETTEEIASDYNVPHGLVTNALIYEYASR